MSILDLSEHAVLQRVESGAIRYAWDIRRASAARGCLRLLARSVVESQLPPAPALSLRGGLADDQRELRAVIESLLPRARVRASDVARLLQCSTEHVKNLTLDGCLRRGPQSVGPKVSPWITRESVVAFLEQRRVA